MTTTFLGQRLYQYSTSGSMGVVTDTHFIRCFWARPSEPVAIFAPGSSGIIVQGPPAPENIIFPDDTVFEEYLPDATSAAVVAAMKAANGKRIGLVNATPEMTEAFVKTYAEVAAGLPKTAAVHVCDSDCHWLIRKTPESSFQAKITLQQAKDIAAGRVDKAEVEAAADYFDVRDTARANPLKVEGGVLVAKTIIDEAATVEVG